MTAVAEARSYRRHTEYFTHRNRNEKTGRNERGYEGEKSQTKPNAQSSKLRDKYYFISN